MTDDLITRARHEAAEDRRIAALALQRHTKDALLQRAQVTDDLVAEIERLRTELVATKGLLAATRSQLSDYIRDFCALRDEIPPERVKQLFGGNPDDR